MNFLSTKHNFSKEIDNLQSLSAKIEKKLSTSDISGIKLDKLTIEELEDMNKIVALTNYMLVKYEDKKETRIILQHFVSIITESAHSIESLNDEISELILSAEDSLNKVKTMHSKFSEKSNLEKSYPYEFSKIDSKTGSINLTNFTTPINTSEYQQNSKGNTVQVI